MKLVEFVPEKRSLSTTEKYMSVGKNGSIVFSHAFTEDLKLKDGEHFKLFNDQENQKRWYFCVNEAGPLKLRTKSNPSSKDSLMVTSSATRDRLLNTLGLPKKTFRLYLLDKPVPHNGMILYGLEYRG